MTVQIQQFEEANKRWERLLQVDIGNETALTFLASNCLESGDWLEANGWIRRLEQTSTETPSWRLYELKARIALSNGDNDRAFKYWKVSVKNGSADSSSLFAIVNIFLAHKDVFHARKCLHESPDEIAGSELGHLVKAKCFMHESRWSDAIRVLEDLDKFETKRSLATDFLYRCYMNDFRHDSAAVLIESQGTRITGEREYKLGKARYKQYRFHDAITNFSKAITQNDHDDSKVWLIRALYAINEHDDAVAKAELTDSLLHVNVKTRARCWEAAGQLKKAEEQYVKATQQSRAVNDWSALISYYMGCRRWGAALHVLKNAQSQGIWNHELESTEVKIESALIAAGIIAPKSMDSLARFDFMSSEAMVTSIVDRILSSDRRIPATKSQLAIKQPRKIALIINSLGPGGAERQAVNLANGLSELDGTDVHVACTYLRRKEQDCFYLNQLKEHVSVAEYYDRTNILQAHDIPELGKYADLICHIQPASRQQLILHMAKRLIELKPDVVHGWLDETFVNVALVCGMLGIRNVVGRWGSMPPGVNRIVSEGEQSNVRYLEHAYRMIARLPFLTYSSNSRLTADAYANLMHINPSLVNIVYNGIDEKKLQCDREQSPNYKEVLGIADNCKVVGTVFRMSEEKRPMLWLEVAKLISSTSDDVHFVVVGTGPFECQMEDYIRRYSLKNIHLVGKQVDIGAWMNMFDIFLLTSRVEGVSNAVVEAQFCGAPVVSANVGGLSEAMLNQKTGILLDDPTCEDFAEATMKLLESPKLLEQFSKQAIEFARKKFSVPNMVESYSSLI